MRRAQQDQIFDETVIIGPDCLIRIKFGPYVANEVEKGCLSLSDGPVLLTSLFVLAGTRVFLF